MTACSVPRLFYGQRCSIRTDNAHSCTCLRAALCIFILPIFPLRPSCLPLCLPFSPCPFSLASLIRFPFFPFPPSLFLLSFVLSFLLPFFFFSHFCVLLCRSEHKNDKQNRHKKVKYSKEGAKHRIFCCTVEAS